MERREPTHLRNGNRPLTRAEAAVLRRQWRPYRFGVPALDRGPSGGVLAEPARAGSDSGR